MKCLKKLSRSKKIILGVVLLFILSIGVFVASVGKENLYTYYLNSKVVTEFRVEGDKLYMDNYINSKTYDQFVEILDKNPNIKTLVEGRISGSLDDDTMIKLAYYVRSKGLNTHLRSDSIIYSGGVDLFLSGVERTAEPGATIGVHSWSDGTNEASDFPRNAPEHEKNRKYIEEMLGKDDFYWFTIYAAPADGIYEMNMDEIRKYGLITDGDSSEKDASVSADSDENKETQK